MKAKPTQILTISNNNFQTKFIHKRPQVNIGKKGYKHSKKPTTDDLWAARQANYFDRQRDKPTNSKHKQSTDKEGKF